LDNFEKSSSHEGLLLENKRLTKISNEMERVIGGEQEKLRETRDSVRALKEQLLDLQRSVTTRDLEM
jgi:hypothetical protein